MGVSDSDAGSFGSNPRYGRNSSSERGERASGDRGGARDHVELVHLSFKKHIFLYLFTGDFPCQPGYGN